jgi:predicted alpha-1,2-mannosidase
MLIAMNLRIFLLIGCIAVVTACKSPEPASPEPVDQVDLFTGTSNSRWMLGPYATVPYGMVQLGPDNQTSGWMGGYEYSIMNVSGFSHIHAWTMSGLRIMPAMQDFTRSDGASDRPYRGGSAGYHSRIEKSTEKASPGYYSCYLYDASCKAEMTASTHCGFHRYSFDREGNARIILSLLFPAEDQAEILDAKILKISDTLIEGYANTIVPATKNMEYRLYFSIRFSKPFRSMGGWINENITDTTSMISGSGDVAAFVNYDTNTTEPVMVKVGLSLVDAGGARNNLKAELDEYGWDFDKAAAAARKQWNDQLSRIQVEGNEKDRKKFYTNLYRSFAKQTWSDADGRYCDPFEEIRTTPEGTAMYGGDAFWNTYWNYNTILSLIAPGIMNNWVNTQLELFTHTGWTNNGPTGLEHTRVMGVTHEMALMVSAYQKGIRNYDVGKLWEAVRHNATVQGGKLDKTGNVGMEWLDPYNKLGYVPYDISKRSSRTLDYSFTDFCTAQLARALGKNEDYEFFLKRSDNWRNQFNRDVKWQMPRDQFGNWKTDNNLFSGELWSEGNAWQYSFYVPHNIPGVVELMGKELFNQRLEDGFEKSGKFMFAAHALDRVQSKVYEYYINQGNEVNMQASWLFNYSGKPWLTQKYTRAILNSYYGDTPYHGWEGDEDEGQMGGWFVITSMGLFEMNGGTTDSSKVDLSAPLFDKITISPDPAYYNGKKFTITTRNNSPENIYIQSAELNGKPLDRSWIYFSDIVNGGTLNYVLGDTPNKDWGKR